MHLSVGASSLFSKNVRTGFPKVLSVFSKVPIEISKVLTVFSKVLSVFPA